MVFYLNLLASGYVSIIGTPVLPAHVSSGAHHGEAVVLHFSFHQSANILAGLSPSMNSRSK